MATTTFSTTPAPIRMMIRTAAVPVSALSDLRLDKSWDVIGRITELDRRLGSDGDRLGDQLYEVIGGADSTYKGDLVALRRCVHSRRRPSKRAWSDEMRAALSTDLAEDIDAWVRRYDLRRELTDSLPKIVDDELHEVQSRLPESLRHNAFRHGLVQGSPVLADQLAKWLDTGAVPQRQTVLRLVKYLARVVAKTSPYSTFTIAGLLTAAPDSGTLLDPPDPASAASIAELNVWLVRRLLSALCADPDLADALTVRRNPSLVSDDERMRFLSPTSNAAVVGTRSSGALAACLERAEQPGTTVADVQTHLRALDPSLDPAAVRQFVGKVVATGVLLTDLPFADQAHDHLAEVADWLRPLPAHAATVARLDALRGELEEYPTLPGPEHRAASRRQVSRSVIDLLTSAQAPDPTNIPRKNVFYDNAVFTGAAGEFDPAAWTPILDDLRAVRDVLAALDPMRAARTAITEAFAVRYGSEQPVPWLDFTQFVSAAMADGVPVRGAALAGPELTALWNGAHGNDPRGWAQLPFAGEQAVAVDAATDLVFRRAAASGPEVDVSAAELTAALGTDAVRAADSMACYGQLLDQGQPQRFALNGVISGYGRGLSRVHRMQEQVGVPQPGGVPWRRTQHGPHGELIAEFDNLFGSNLNLRTPSTTVELDYPYSTSARPGERLRLNDLDVRHDADRDELVLVSRVTGDRIRPMHGGMVASFWLPEPVRRLIEIFGPIHSPLHASVPLFVPRGGDIVGGGIRNLPRLSIGSVVLSRRSWVLPSRVVPHRHSGESDAALWVRWAGWFAEQGIPERFYVRAAGLRSAWSPEMKSRKPTYVDLSSWHLVAVLERTLSEESDLVVIAEALPDLTAAPRYNSVDGVDGAQHVTELVVELPASGGSGR